MSEQVERMFGCPVCGDTVTTRDRRKMYCSKRCADRSRNGVIQPIEASIPGRTYRAKSPTGIGAYDSVSELRFFSRLTDEGKKRALLGEGGFTVAGFDIEATHLKPNVGRIICVCVKPLGGEVKTFTALDREYKMKDVYDDSRMAAAVRDELEKYDIIVGWNSKEFDVKFINSRALRGGYRTKRPQYHIDGMWSWRSKFNAWSGLNNVQRFALPDNETEKTSIAWEQWMRVIGWNRAMREQAMAEIVDHCVKDVIVLEDVYRALAEANVLRSIRKDGGVL